MYENSVDKELDSKKQELALYRQIFSNSRDAIAVFDPDGFYIEQNHAHRALLGYSDEELQGKTPALHLGEDLFSTIFRILSDENIYRGELVSYTKEGRTINLDLSALSIKNEHGDTLYYVWISGYKQNSNTPEVNTVEVEDDPPSSDIFQIFEAMHSSLDERQLLHDFMHKLPGFCNINRAVVFMHDKASADYISVASFGFSSSEESILHSRHFSAREIPALRTVQKGEPLYIESAGDSLELSREFVDMFHIESLILVPLFIRKKFKGVLLGEQGKANPLNSRDISLLKEFAKGLGIAINNSRLYKESTARLMELNNRIETTKEMSFIDKEILSALDRDTVLKTAIAMISRVIPCDRVAVLFREQSVYRVVAEWGTGHERRRAFELSEHQMDIIENVRAPIFIPDLSLEKDQSQYNKALVACEILSSILVPLVSEGSTIGFVTIGSKSPAKLTSTHLATAESITSQIAVALNRAGLYENLQQLIINTITSFASIIDAKSPWTKGHSERVTQYAVATGIEMGMDLKSLENLRLAGVLHDIGKIGTYDVLLDKPDTLTKKEFELIKKHPSRGAEMLEPIQQLAEIIPIIRHHHEKFDGTGHPDGLKGKDIPAGARIIAVADAYDSMTADRPYRSAPGKHFAIEEIRKCSGTQFDPEVVEAFFRILW